MHNVTADQIEKNKQLIRLVKNFPQIYNHDPTTTQQSGESVEEIWAKIGQELQETRKYKSAGRTLNATANFSFPSQPIPAKRSGGCFGRR